MGHSWVTRGHLACRRSARAETLADDPDGVRDGHHLLGLAARAHAGHLEELAELSRWARPHDSLASFTTVITAPSGAPNARVRNRWDHLCTTVTNVLTEGRKREKATPPTEDEAKEAAFWIAHRAADLRGVAARWRYRRRADREQGPGPADGVRGPAPGCARGPVRRRRAVHPPSRPAQLRYIRVVDTLLFDGLATTTPNWWSIDELNLYNR
jgi:hypothetical protein